MTEKEAIIVPIVLAIAVVLAFVVLVRVYLYRSIVRKDNRCESAWKVIDDQLRRRNALVPRLVQSVQSQTEIDKAVLSQINVACNSLEAASMPEAKMAASAELSSALNQLIELTAHNPQLESNESFRQIREELSDVDTKLSYARANYNDCVLDFNNTISTFPGKLVSGSRFRERQGFEAVGDTARQPLAYM